jgi:hypothetical protein
LKLLFEKEIKTVPTGFLVVPPPGPAIPVQDTEKLFSGFEDKEIIFFDISDAVLLLTEPNFFIVSSKTLANLIFEWLEYVTIPKSYTIEEPGIEVMI